MSILDSLFGGDKLEKSDHQKDVEEFTKEQEHEVQLMLWKRSFRLVIKPEYVETAVEEIEDYRFRVFSIYRNRRHDPYEIWFRPPEPGCCIGENNFRILAEIAVKNDTTIPGVILRMAKNMQDKRGAENEDRA